MKKEQSIKLYQEALQYFPGGVNSPVRAFRSVEGTPLFIEKGDGCFIWDADGNKYIDFCASWGPLILGHNNQNVRSKIISAISNGTSFGAPSRLENELADLILSNNKYIEKIRFVSSGTEAVMSAIRLARGFTKRDKIIKFEGCYHGHADSLLVKAGSGLATLGISSSAGIPKSFANETIVLPLNNKEAVVKAFKDFPNEIACVIIEPIPANNGLLLQDKDYLMFLREICTENRSLLLFDEVISGFRISFEGAAGFYEIQPDLITYGKIIGGGLPVGAYAGSENIMSYISPDGPVYQAGTLSGNPIAMTAGIAQLTECLGKYFYEDLEDKTLSFANAINDYAKINRYDFKVFSIGSIFWFAFANRESIQRADEIDIKSINLFKPFHRLLLERGVYIGPSGYEVCFISEAHTSSILHGVQRVVMDCLDEVF